MATKRLIPDPDFGQIILRTHRRARNITMRPKPGGLYVTAPPYSKVEKVLEAVAPFRARLLEQYRGMTPRPIGWDFALRTECFRLWLEPAPVRHFTVCLTDEGVRVCCPAETDFADEGVQKRVRAAILRGMKRAAERYLPPLLEEWAGRFGLTFTAVRITSAKSRWGSCTGGKRISLSCYLMLLPPHLMDYVLLHELAHTREMNHGPEFWALLDRLAGGRALQLRKELRGFRPAF